MAIRAPDGANNLNGRDQDRKVEFQFNCDLRTSARRVDIPMESLHLM